MKNHSIQALKAVCALMVFCSHSLNMPESPVIHKIAHSPLHIFFDGQVAVIVFIVISGFFYQKDQRLSKSAYLSGIKKKLLRVYMPYVIVILLGALVCNIVCRIEYDRTIFTQWSNSFWGKGVSLSDLTGHIIPLLPHDPDLINPPCWYVVLEIKLFLTIPLAVMMANTYRGGRLIYIPLIALTLLGYANYVGSCLMGCVSRIVYDKNARKLKDLRHAGLFKTLALITAVLMLNINNEVILPPNLAFALQSLGASILVPVVYSLNSPAFANKTLQWIAGISYEIYLVHFIVLLALRPFYTGFVSYIAASLMLTLLLSMALKKSCVSLASRIESNKPVRKA